MTIVKSAKFRENLAQLLKNSYDEDIFIDYYGQLFQITPVQKSAKKLTQAQKLIAKYSNLKPMKLIDPIFNESDPAQEKANFRNLRYAKYEQ